MGITKRYGFILLLVALPHCTKPKENPQVPLLLKQLGTMENDLKGYEKKIRDASENPGLKVRLEEDRELLRSRIERAKALVKKLDPKALQAEGAEGGGGGHH